MKRYLGFLAILTALVSSVGAQEDYTQWSAFKQYRVNTTASGVGTQLNASVLKFPLLIRLGAADSNVFKQTRLVSGMPADLRFVKSDGVNRLKHQVERWDSAGRTAEVWVLLDTLYNNNNTRTTRMYWGHASAADSSNGTAVFDTALGDQAVWHMNATVNTSNENDATVNAFTANQNGNPGLVTSGAIGRARSFVGGSATAGSEGNASGTAGNNEYFRVANSATGKLNFPANGKYTISAWINPTSTASPGGVGGRVIVSKHDLQYSLKLLPGGFPQTNGYNNFRTAFGHATGPWAYQPAASTTAVTPAQWIHIAAVRDTLTLRLYVNGAAVATNLGNADSNFTAGADTTLAAFTDSVVYIGRQAETNNRYFQGQMDEVRISNVVRSANYLRMSYQTQRADQVAVNALTPPTIAYTQASASFEAGYVAAPVAPALASGFPALTFSVAPALPTGLTLNTATGVISGLPSAATAAANYVVTATNSEGTSLDTISITVTAATEANYSAWTGTKTVNFSTTAAGAGITTAQSQFPLLVRLTPSADSLVFVQAKAGGADLRFSRANGTRLRYQIEQWDAVSRNAAIWVQMDNVTPNGANELRIHWGNAGANSQSNGNGVFPADNGFAGVWHLGNTSDTNARPNAVSGAPAAVPTRFGASYVTPKGAIGMADTLGGGNNAGGAYLDINLNGTDSAYYANFTGGLSFSVWAYPTGVQQYARFVTLAGSDVVSNPPHDIALGRNNLTNTLRYEHRNATASLGTVDGLEGIQLNQWQHYTVTVSGSTVNLYRNGVLVGGPQNLSGALVNTPRRRGYLGRTSWNDSLFKGLLDEAVLSRTVRSADWIKLSYKTQKPGVAPISNLVYSAPSPSYTAGTAITANTPTVSGPVTRFVISPALPAGLVFNDATGVISGTPSATGAGSYTVTAWSDSAWSATATLNITVGIPAETYSQWAQKRDLFINTAIANTTVPSGAGIMSNVLKFPLLVRLDSSNFATGFTQATKTGIDIRFTKAGDVVRLPHQIERWDSAARKADIWVLVDTVRPNLRNQLIRMHWQKTTGGAAIDASSGSSVFGSANGFTAVWHLADSANQTDASGNGNTATASAAMPTHNAASLIGAGKTFNGSTNWYQIGTDSTALQNVNTNTGPYTLTAWVNPASCDARIAAIAKYTNGANPPGRQFALHTSQGFTDWRFTNGATAVNGTGDGEFTADASGSCVTNVWSHIVGTYNSGAPTSDSSVNARIYVNGALAGQGAFVSTTGVGRQANTYIGRIHGTERYMNGSLDEITVSAAQRDTSWIKLAYASQRPGANVVVHTTAPVAIGTAESRVIGTAFAVKAQGRGLLLQVPSEKAGTAQIAIIDVQGRTDWNRTAQASAGMNGIIWNGQGNNGQAISSGVYVVQVSLMDADNKAVRTMRKTVPFTP
jgi:hypothetical protein